MKVIYELKKLEKEKICNPLKKGKYDDAIYDGFRKEKMA
jgi:hypothetical protein